MSAPDEARALEALKTVQSIPAKDLDQLVTDEIGQSLLGVFAAMARAMGPDDDRQETARKVHLMVLAYLMRGELDSAPKKSPAKKQK
ncbi:MAG: hypothetical protein AB2A00_05905 [Myxococcota bacterium]